MAMGSTFDSPLAPQTNIDDTCDGYDEDCDGIADEDLWMRWSSSMSSDLRHEGHWVRLLLHLDEIRI